MAEREDNPQPMTVGGVGEKEFNLWKQSPLTRLYFQYLRDMAKDTEAATVAHWKQGGLQIATADELRGRVLTLEMASDPQFEAMATFYREIKEMKENESDEQPD